MIERRLAHAHFARAVRLRDVIAREILLGKLYGARFRKLAARKAVFAHVARARKGRLDEPFRRETGIARHLLEEGVHALRAPLEKGGKLGVGEVMLRLVEGAKEL